MVSGKHSDSIRAAMGSRVTLTVIARPPPPESGKTNAGRPYTIQSTGPSWLDQRFQIAPGRERQAAFTI